MKKKKKKKAASVIFFYLLLTTGLWMFIISYSNSYNRLSMEKISPASLNLSADSAEMSVLEHTICFRTGKIKPESKLYFILYMLAPDDVRALSLLISLPYKL